MTGTDAPPVISRTRRWVAGVAAVVLLALAAWCVTRGVEVRASTGGLLTEPVATTRIAGGWLVGAAVAATAGVLAGVEAGTGLLASRRRAGRTR